MLGGALLVTQTSLRTMAERTGRSVISVARPIGRVTRRAIRGSVLVVERSSGIR
jgi:DNA segregation ATPase FtsK/SpoIIIE, S-DNA-T family